MQQNLMAICARALHDLCLDDADQSVRMMHFLFGRAEHDAEVLAMPPDLDWFAVMKLENL